MVMGCSQHAIRKHILHGSILWCFGGINIMYYFKSLSATVTVSTINSIQVNISVFND